MHERKESLARRTTRMGSVFALVTGTLMATVTLAAGCGKLDRDDELNASDGGAQRNPSTGLDASSARDARNDVSRGPTCGPCIAPESFCVDDHTMRSFFSQCGDSGTCEVTSNDITCMPGVEPYCFNGSCQPAIVR